MKQFVRMVGDVNNFKTREYLGVFDYVPNIEDFEEGDYFRYNESFFGVSHSCLYICLDLPHKDSEAEE